MLRLFHQLVYWSFLFCCILPAAAQSRSDSISQAATKLLQVSQQKSSIISNHVNCINYKSLKKWEQQQRRLLRKISRKDSLAGKQLREQLAWQKATLLRSLADPASSLKEYIPSLDTLNSALKFLQEDPSQLLAGKADPQLLNRAADKLNALQGSMGQAEQIGQFMQQQQQLLRERLSSLGLLKDLKALNKTAYYYQAQIHEYKSLLKDHKKATRKALAVLQNAKPFKDFMRKHSQLASLFRLPADPNDPSQTMNLAGLQTRAQVNNLIQQQISSGGPSAAAQLRANISQAQSQLNEVKDKLIKLGGGSSDMTMPDGFRPNPYKTKSFLNRLDIGANIQSQRARGWLPARSDIGLSAGYIFQPNIIAGIGGSYRVGWGKDIRHIRISHQGNSLRSFVELKLKGSFWLTGGYERNQVAEGDADGNPTGAWSWQPGGLVGVSKVISTRSKLMKKTKLMLLWDFLAGRNGNTGQPVVFRIGYVL